MPTYEYRCQKCGHVFERSEHVADHEKSHPIAGLPAQCKLNVHFQIALDTLMQHVRRGACRPGAANDLVLRVCRRVLGNLLLIAAANENFYRYTTPCFMTKRTFARSVTWRVGSPSTAMRSADLPGASVPISSKRSR